MSLFEEFELRPGAYLKGAHVSLNLKDILDVYSPQVYELVGGGRLPEQRAKGPGDYAGAGGLAPQFIPGKVIEQTKAILARGDLADELKEYLENAKSKMPGKFKQSVQNMLILAARQSRTKCAVLLIDEYGADVNTVSNVKKHSSLHFAAYNGDVGLAKELLTRGASKTLTNIYDETPEQTADNQAQNDGGDDMRRERYETCRDLIEGFQLSTEAAAANSNRSGLDSISTYVPTSKSGEKVDTFLALSRASMGILNKVTDDNEAKMLKRLQDLVPVSGFNTPERARGDKFELRHFKLIVENLWKTAIAQPSMAGLYASLADKLHSHFAGHAKDMTTALATNSGKFYRMVFDEKLMTPLYDSERTALAEAAKCVNFKRELLIQCQQQFNSERDLARFRRAVDWKSLTDELAVLRAENDVMYARNKAQDRMTANVVFIGQLFNHGLATTSIIRMCVEDLLPESRVYPADVVEAAKTDKEALSDYTSGLENDLTMLVKLIEVIGQKFEKGATPVGPNASPVAVAAFEKAKKAADRRRKLLAKWFKAMKRITDPTKLGVENEFKLQNRVRFAVQDLVELRSRGWMTRNLAEAKGGAKKATTDDDGWTSVPGGGGAGGGAGSPKAGDSIVTANPTAAPSHLKKKSKAQRKADKARAAAAARAAEAAARRVEVNKEAQAVADELYALDQEAERIRVQIDKHMSGPKQARPRQKARLRIKALKGQRSRLKTELKAARAKGPDAPEPAAAPAPAAAATPELDMGGDDFFELPELSSKNKARLNGMLKEFLEVTRDFAEFALSLSEMELAGDEATAAVPFFLLCYACESLSSASKKDKLDLVIALLKHLIEHKALSAAQLALARKAFECIIDDIKMDAPLAGKVYDEIKKELGFE